VRVVVLHNAVSAQPTPDERDVLVQLDAVSAALSSLGHEAIPLPCDLELNPARQRLAELRPEVVFNLVESLGGQDRLLHLAAGILEELGLPYTGAPQQALFTATSKLWTKERLRAAGLRTPAWVALPGPGMEGHSEPLAPPYLIKTVWEHGSFGLEDDAVVRDDDVPVVQRLRRKALEWGRPCFAEAYIDGREFNLSLLTEGGEPRVLPPAEIDFSAFPAGKPHIVGYRAKWAVGSFEYDHTPRSFEFSGSDAGLLARLEREAVACWHAFGLRGYGRVDFRIDREGRPWILEVNANPCLSPDAGFAAALARAGISFPETVRRLLGDALRR
jgi:D-alanine-D-alanine ligase